MQYLLRLQSSPWQRGKDLFRIDEHYQSNSESHFEAVEH